ncbi:MAG: hypothetical protein HY515_01420 [Candidatus Aenigmarchaeota archaeon]|nr:hypothetical protein [Candidatus Aenigmarchaeota archaeon]
MHERVAREIELMREKYPKLEHGEHLNWVLIPDYPLPPNRYNKERTQLLFTIPAGYPNTGPDDFFVDGDLRLSGGAEPPGLRIGSNSSSGPAPIPGNWAWFSWHPVRWKPTATIEGGDNLLSFLRGVNLCLEGIEAT